MSRAQTSELVNEYCYLFRELNIQYDVYAKSVGLSYDSALVLSILYGHEDGCTQKDICDETFLTKQTVNSIITSLLKQGFVKLTEVENNRRMKIIQFTEDGAKYAEGIVPKIKYAENKAMDSLTTGERETLIATTRLYISRFREFINEEDSG
jgi:DNA-binding MarR family transcriptional regulator